MLMVRKLETTLFIGSLLATALLFVVVLLFPQAYRTGVHLVDVVLINRVVVTLALLAMAGAVLVTILGGISLVYEKLRIWLARWQGDGYYKYKDPDRRQ